MQLMSAVDLAWLRMERATNPMMIVGVLTFAGRLSYPTLLELLSTRLLRFQRFRQVPRQEATGTYWVEDRTFALESHVHELALPARGGRAQLETVASDLASTPLDPRRPMWQMHLIGRYGRGSALIARFHHCYADGIALLRVLLSLTDEESAGASADAHGQANSHASDPFGLAPLLGSGLTMVQEAVHGAVGVLDASLHALSHPQETIGAMQQIVAASRELANVAALAEEPTTPLKGKLSTRKQLAWTHPLPLSEVKTIARTLGSTVNDVLLATVAGAFGSYLRSNGTRIDDLSIRALVPVNLRPPAATPELGNRFGLVFVELPISERNPLARVMSVRARMQALKVSAQPALSLWLLAAMGLLPGAVEEQGIELFTRKATLVISNVPGPQQALHVAGARIEQLHFWVPQAGSIGIGVSILTYDGWVHFGVMADRQLIAQPAAVARRFGAEFEKLLLGVVCGATTRAT